MTKLEEYTKKRQEELKKLFEFRNSGSSIVSVGTEEMVESFLSETEDGMIEIFRGLVGEVDEEESRKVRKII